MSKTYTFNPAELPETPMPTEAEVFAELGIEGRFDTVEEYDAAVSSYIAQTFDDRRPLFESVVGALVIGRLMADPLSAVALIAIANTVTVEVADDGAVSVTVGVKV